MAMKTYEAILANPASTARVVAARPAIERAGGSVKLAPPTSAGMILATLILPDGYMPQDFVPGLPFYLV